MMWTEKYHQHLQQSRFKMDACLNYYASAGIPRDKNIFKTLENMKMKENSKERTIKANKGLFAFKQEVDLLMYLVLNPEAFQHFTSEQK